MAKPAGVSSRSYSSNGCVSSAAFKSKSTSRLVSGIDSNCVFACRAVNTFKIELNLANFGSAVAPLTLAFKTISEKIRQIELKLATPAGQDAVVEATQHSLGTGLGLKGQAG